MSLSTLGHLVHCNHFFIVKDIEFVLKRKGHAVPPWNEKEIMAAQRRTRVKESPLWPLNFPKSTSVSSLQLKFLLF